MNFRTLIAERSPAERDYLRHLLANEKDFQVLTDPAEPECLTETVAEVRPDVLFLDVNLPDPGGLRIAEELRDLPFPALVFTATDCRLAGRAFELAAADFILKPFEYPSLKVALERVRHRVARDRYVGGQGVSACGAGDGCGMAGPRRRLLVRTIGQTRVLQTRTIDRIDSEGNYVRISSAGEKLRVRAALGSIESDLDPRQFVRVHRCTLVNVDRIVWIELPATGDHILHLTNGSSVPLARGRREKLYRILRGG